MSGKAVGWAFEQRVESPSAKLVLLKLADNACEWEAWPAVSTIAADTELSERAVRTALRKLEAQKLIIAELRFKGGRQLSTKYRLNSEGWIPPGAKVVGAPPAGGAGDAPRHQVPRAPAPNAGAGGHEVPPNPYLEPVIEPVTLGAQARERQISPRGGAHSPSSTSPSDSPRSPAGDVDAGPRWGPIWNAFRAWPGLAPHASERRARAAWDALRAAGAVPGDGDLIDCIAAHGRWLAAENAERAKRQAGQHFVRHPERWLRDRCWQGYLDALHATRVASARKQSELRDSIGADALKRLKAAGFSDVELTSWFDEVRIEHGPPLRIVTGSKVRYRRLTENFSTRLRRAFGDDVQIDLRMAAA